MTTEELYQKLDNKLSAMDTKLDTLTAKVERHDVYLETNGREAKEIKDRLGAVEKRQELSSKDIVKVVGMEERVYKLEGEQSKINKFIWALLGSGVTSGVGIAKLFGF